MSTKDIKKKLQKLEGLQDKSLRELVQIAEKVFYNRETEEEKEEKRQKEQEVKPSLVTQEIWSQLWLHELFQKTSKNAHGLLAYIFNCRAQRQADPRVRSQSGLHNKF